MLEECASLLQIARLESIPPGASNRLYHNNRNGTFSDVTEQAGLLEPDGRWASAWATTTTMD